MGRCERSTPIPDRTKQAIEVNKHDPQESRTCKGGKEGRGWGVACVRTCFCNVERKKKIAPGHGPAGLRFFKRFFTAALKHQKTNENKSKNSQKIHIVIWSYI